MNGVVGLQPEQRIEAFRMSSWPVAQKSGDMKPV
jgi:hypothetical protein